MTWRKHISEALEYADGKYNLDDIEQRIRARTAILFTSDKSSAVVWVEDYPQVRSLVVAFGGGDLDDILAHIPTIRDYGREVGCTQVDVYGRPGWSKVLKKHGFRQSSVIMSIGV